MNGIKPEFSEDPSEAVHDASNGNFICGFSKTAAREYVASAYETLLHA